MKFGADFDALIARSSPDPQQPIGLAVSGGSDSLALLLLTAEWARRSGRSLHVFTVDHGFRPEAKAEAEWVAARTAALGHSHQTLTWQAPKRTQKAARLARYELMCQALHTIGGTSLLVGHTHDDVVETAIIRRKRGVRNSSIAGPTLMSPAPVWPAGRGIALIRPLVAQTRANLRAFLTQKDWTWVDDPSNAFPEFERVRVRTFLSRHPRLHDICARYVQGLQKARSAEDSAIGEALQRVLVYADGLIDTYEAPISPRLLTILTRCASGSASDPRAKSVIDMIAALHRPGLRQTLGGAWFQKKPRGFIIGRDPGADLDTSLPHLFDGRFELVTERCLPSIVDQSFLVCQTCPHGDNWRELISERIAHIALCLKTPEYSPLEL